MWFEFGIEPGGDQRFLDLPWEVLADDGRCLANRDELSFSVVRRIGRHRTAAAPSRYRPAVAFMAADPRGNTVPLDHDAEEQAIIGAVGAVELDFLCEDSGNLALLATRMRDQTEGDAGVNVVHLSCHGSLRERPVLLMETELGEPEAVDAQALAREFGGFRPRLLFLSACETARPDGMLGSLAADLVKLGFPCVLGWSGKVSDRGATRFAQELYARLAARDSIEMAVALARQVLAHDADEVVRSDWHRARVYLGPDGGGPMTRGQRRRHWHDADRADQEFLGKGATRIPVASRREFVGRRRPIQEVLRHLRKHRPTVIHGLGQHGKSSLAARIASRHLSHDVVLVAGDYTPGGILNAIRESARDAGHDGTEEVLSILDEADDISKTKPTPEALARAGPAAQRTAPGAPDRGGRQPGPATADPAGGQQLRGRAGARPGRTALRLRRVEARHRRIGDGHGPVGSRVAAAVHVEIPVHVQRGWKGRGEPPGVRAASRHARGRIEARRR